MKLFFSYGHDKNEEIVLRLKADLERRKHSIWIDKSSIKSGDDWRRTITSGILESELMMSFASNHSVRKPGVCLDELMIAVSVKGAQVQTVLLESDVIPPANIGYRQYIDMSKWQEMKDSRDFENWYAEKLNEIIRVIESPETAKYVEEIEYLKEQLCPDLSTMKKDRLQQEFFCGREWLSQSVAEWIRDKDAPKILLIDGAPGIGKSSYMAHEFIFNASVGAIIFCEWDQPNFNNLDSISRSLAFQLAAKIPDYRYQLIKYLKNEQLRTGEKTYLPQSGERVFQLLFLQQLKNLIDGDRPVILILIDGIDEVMSDKSDNSRRRNVFAELLQKEMEHFPRWIRFVITSRRDVRVLKPLQNAYRLHIEESSQDNRQDLLKYMEHELRDETDQENIKKAAEKSAGNFLYAKMVCKALKEHRITLPEIMDGEAGDLGYIYRSYFDRTFPDFDEYEERYYIPMAALAVTEEAIPQSTFQKIAGWSERQMNQYLKVLSPYLSAGREYLGLYHKSLRDWLLAPEADDYMIDKEDGIRAIADGCYVAYEKDISGMNSYEMKYLLPLLEQIHDDRVKQIKENEDYADRLMSKAKEEKEQFQYEMAICFAEMALSIYSSRKQILKVLSTYLFLAEAADLMVHLDEADGFCTCALNMAADHLQNSSVREMAGDIQMRLAYVCFRQAQWERSIACYEEACQNFAECAKQKKQIEALMMKANVLRHASRCGEALACYKAMEEIPIFFSLKEDDLSLYANVLMNYGWTLHNAENTDKYRYEKAAEKLMEAEQLIKADTGLIPIKDVAQLYYLRAVELFDRADYEKAAEYCRKSLHYVQIAYGDNSVEICSALNQLGAIVQKQNDHPKAIQLFRRSYEMRLNYYGEKNLYTSISLRNYAKALFRSGKEESLPMVGKIFADVCKLRHELCTNEKGTGWLGQIHLDLAEYNERIKNYPEAERFVLQAEKFYRTCGMEKEIGTCKLQMGIIRLSQNRIEEAKAELLESLRIRKKHYHDEEHTYIREVKSQLKRCEELSGQE